MSSPTLARQDARQDPGAGRWTRFKEMWHTLKEDEPGKRFVHLYKKRREDRQGGFDWGRLAITTLGAVVSIAGVVFLAMPGPGLLVLALGLALMASESLALAKVLDWAESRIRPVALAALNRWQQIPPLRRKILTAITAVLGVASLSLFLLWRRF